MNDDEMYAYYDNDENIQIDPRGEVRRRPRPDVVAVRSGECEHLSIAGRLKSVSCGTCGPIRLRYPKPVLPGTSL